MSYFLLSRPTFMKKFIIAVTGDFGRKRSHPKIKYWIEHAGGRFATKVEFGVTHLVCSFNDYKKSVPMVRAAQNVSREAKRRGVPHKKVHIVHFDWLEDSLMKGAAQDPHHYDLWHRLEAAAETERRKKANAAKKKAILKKGMEAFEKGRKDFQADFGSDGYHLYYDNIGFAYEVKLTRPSPHNNQNELYILKLYESDAVPRRFAVCVHHSGPGLLIEKEILAWRGTDFPTAYGKFEMKFMEIMNQPFDQGWGVIDTALTEFSYVRPRELMIIEPEEVLRPRGLGLKMGRY